MIIPREEPESASSPELSSALLRVVDTEAPLDDIAAVPLPASVAAIDCLSSVVCAVVVLSVTMVIVAGLGTAVAAVTAGLSNDVLVCVVVVVIVSAEFEVSGVVRSTAAVKIVDGARVVVGALGHSFGFAGSPRALSCLMHPLLWHI